MFRAQRIAGRFQLEEEAAKGGMGTVYRATDQKTQRKVAVKVLRKREVVSANRFVREAALLAELRHPAIVEYITHGTTSDGLHFLVMEWVDGETLAQRMERTGLDLAETVTVGIQIAEALAIAHQKGMVHRDVKPNNLMFVGGQLEKVKVLDFGIARRSHEVGELTQTGVMVGTMGYMSPEQARGTRQEVVDGSVDVFALGCVLYECLTGRSPFTGDNMMAVRAKILYADPLALRALVPGIPMALEAIVLRMLAKNAGDRFASGAEAAAALRTLGKMPAVPRRKTGQEEPATAVTPIEQKQVAATAPLPLGDRSVLLISVGHDEPDEDDETVSEPVDFDAEVAKIGTVAKRFGGLVDGLGEGSIIVTLAGPGTAQERAENAARLAIAIKPLVPTGTISVATEVDDKNVIDRLLDRGARTLGMGMASIDESFLDLDREPEASIWLDDETARLIRGKFDVRRNTAGHRLHGER